MTALCHNVKRLSMPTTVLRTGSNRGNGCRVTLHRHNKLEARVALFLTLGNPKLPSHQFCPMNRVWGITLEALGMLDVLDRSPPGTISSFVGDSLESWVNLQSLQEKPKTYRWVHGSASTCWSESRSSSSVQRLHCSSGFWNLSTCF